MNMEGGNAVDGAIAANAVEAVVEPMMNGMGGDLMAMVWMQGAEGEEGKLHGYNGAGRAPAGQSLAELKAEIRRVNGEGGSPYIPKRGPMSVTVPGAVKGWCDLHDRFGKVAWAKLFEPAIAYAEKGFAVSPVIATEWEMVARDDEGLTSGGKYPQAGDGFWDTFAVDNHTRAPRAGEMFYNRDMASTLRVIAEEGCEGFYNGSVAEAIDAFSAASGLRITKEDMATHQGEWVDPVNTTYRDDFRVFELPPNPQGIAVIEALNILEGYDLAGMGFNSADYLHVQIEAKKLAFADAARYYADPAFVDVPVEGLISKDYAAQRRELIDMDHAADEVPSGDPMPYGAPVDPRETMEAKYGGDTMYLTVADDEGNMVSLIQSLYNGFGSGLVVPGLGFCLQDRGALFATSESHANVYAPGKRPFHTIIPGFVTKDDEPWLSFGVMGGYMQPQGQVQILSNMIDFGMNVQEAGDAARFYHYRDNQPTGQVMTDGGTVQLEAGVCGGIVADLVGRGHNITRGGNTGGYQAIERVPVDGSGSGFVYWGASEMRKDGQAAGL